MGNKRYAAIGIGLSTGLFPFITVLTVLCYIQFIGKFSFDKKLQYFDGLIIGQTLMIVTVTLFVTPTAIFKINKFTDLISIKYELIGLCFIFDIFSLAALIWIVFFHNETIKSRSNHVRIYLFVIICLLCASTSFIMISWVGKKFKQKQRQINNNILSSKTSTKQMRIDLIQQVTAMKSRMLSLDDILSHKIGYRLFMRHLVNEFAVENLLFLTEVVHYRKSKIFSKIIEKENKIKMKLKQIKNKHNTSKKMKTKRKHNKFTLSVESKSEIKQNIKNNINYSYNDIDSEVEIDSTVEFESKSHSPIDEIVINYHDDDNDNNNNNNVQSKSKNVKNTIDMYINNFIDYPVMTDKIPQSNIMKEKNVFDKISMILNRYVSDRAQLQVNISYINRQQLFLKEKQSIPKLKKQMENWNNNNSVNNVNDNKNVNGNDNERKENDEILNSNEIVLIELYQFFDESCQEIIRLLNTSFKNFTNSDEYKQFEKEMQRE